jgi:hypothetical protein
VGATSVVPVDPRRRPHSFTWRSIACDHAVPRSSRHRCGS